MIALLQYVVEINRRVSLLSGDDSFENLPKIRDSLRQRATQALSKLIWVWRYSIC